MSLAVHHNSEIGKIFLTVVAVLAFVVIALTWVPDWVSPRMGGEITGSTGATSRMLK